MSNQVYTIDELKLKIGSILSNFPVEKAILFGSYAKNEANKDSDIDLVVDMTGEADGFKFLEILGLLCDSLRKDVDLIELGDIIKDGKIDNEISRTGVIIYGK